MITSDLQRSIGEEESKLLLEAIALFNMGKFWESHEVFEDLWRSEQGELKKFAQGLVQAAAAFSYIKLRRYESILYLFDKSREKLQATIHLLPGLRMNLLIQAIGRAKAAVQRIGEGGLERFDPALFPRISFSGRSSRGRKSKGIKGKRIR